MSALRDAMVYGLDKDGRALKFWKSVRPFVYTAAYVGAVVVIYQQWLPVWLGFAIFMLPTVGFVACVIVALIDPYSYMPWGKAEGGIRIVRKKQFPKEEGW